MSAKIKAMYRKAGMKSPNGKGIHTEKFHRMVTAIGTKGGAVNPYAVAMAKLGRGKAVKKSHRRNAMRSNRLRGGK